MNFNPEFLEYLDGEFALAVREVIADRLGLSLPDIPVFCFADEVLGEHNPIGEAGENETLIRVKAREDGTPYAINVDPNAIEVQASIFLACKDDIAELAIQDGCSEQEVQRGLIWGAGFEVVARSLLQTVNPGANSDEFRTIRELAKIRLGLKSYSSKE